MRKLLIPFMLIFVVGCQNMPIDTPRKQLALAEGVYTTAANTAAALVVSDRLDGDDIDQLERVNNMAKASLDEARVAVENGSPTLEVAIRAALAAVGQFNAFANQKQQEIGT